MPEWTERLRDSPWLGPVLAVALAAAPVAELIAEGSSRTALLTALAIAPIAVMFRRPVAAACASAALLLAAQVLAGNAEFPATVLLAAAALSFASGTYATRDPGAAGVAALWASMVLPADDAWVPATFALVGPWVAGRAVGARAELVAALAERTRELEDEQDAFTRLAVLHERARIARELHDVVSHHLAVMVVQAGAGRMATTDEPARAAERFAGIREAGGEALTQVARLLDLLEAERESLRRLLERARAAGLDVQATVNPDDLELDGAALRVVQEALTNVLKHAPGADVEVRVEQRDDVLEITVRDRGARIRPTLADTGAGSGLASLRERVAAAGGQLEAGPASGGWQVHAELPRTPVGAGEVRH
jgi:signal transduction histidine kinase